MTDYKTIRGKKIKIFSTDLDNAESEGQIFYNSTDFNFKTSIATAAFSAGANLITSRSDFRGTFGTQSAFKGAGGFTTLPPGNTPAITNVEDYDGTGFSTATALPLATRNQAGGGTQTAGWIAGGRRFPTSPANKTAETQEWDGSSWSEGGDLGSAKYGNSGTGTATAGLSSGGYNTANLNETEEYNGTSWAEQNNLGTARYRTAAVGTQTATILFGGGTYPGSPPDVNNVEEYDGTSWTALTNLPTIRGMGHSFGTTTNAIVTGGRAAPGATNTSVSWNGSAFSSAPNLGTARFNGGDGQITTKGAGIVAGGFTPPTNALSTTEEFNITAATITAAAWSGGGNLGSSRYEMGSANQSPQTAALGFGGYEPGGSPKRSAKTEEYDGSSWTESGDLSTGRNALGGAGTQTAGLAFGGYDGSNHQNSTEEYGGSSWTAGGNMVVGKSSNSGCGTQTAGLSAGQNNGDGISSNIEEYNGSSWSEVTNMSNARRDATAFGIQTAAVVAGGEISGNAYSGVVEEYDGTSWTTGGALMIGHRKHGSAGTSTSGIVFGGQNSVPNNNSAKTQFYDGTSFITFPSLATGRQGIAGSGTSTAGLAFGKNPPGNGLTEEFTGETTAINLKTITDS